MIKKKLALFLVLSLFHFSANAEKVPENRLSLNIDVEKKVFHVFDDIQFTLVLTPRVSGELPTWDSTRVSFELIRFVDEATEQEEVVGGNFDKREENSRPITPIDLSSPNQDRVLTIYPEVEYIFREAGDTYSLPINLRNDVFTDDDAALVTLPIGKYRMKVVYDVILDKTFEEAQVDFVVTAKDKVVESIDHWAAIIASPESDDRELDQAIDDILTFTFQDYVYSDSLDQRRKAAQEYSLWIRHQAAAYPLFVEPSDMSEYLEYDVPSKQLPLEIYDFGGDKQTVDTQSINLSGKLRTFVNGFDSIIISNNRLPSTRVEATRVEYENWNATVPLLVGPNTLSLIARDLAGRESATTIFVTREE